MFDKQHRLTFYGSDSFQGKYLAYDDNDNIRTINDIRQTSYKQTLTYDKNNRLVSATSSGLGNQYYACDSLGNRTYQSGSVSQIYGMCWHEFLHLKK